jgi:hypothetical protein
MANQKFFRRGKTQMRFLPTVAATTLIPTAAECAAGTDLGPLLETVKGFSFTNKAIPIPNLATPFTGEIPGEDTAPQSTLTFYRQDTPNTLRTTLAKGTVGFIVVAHFKIGTLAAADIVDTWPIISAGTPDQFDLTNNAAKWDALVDHTAAPQLDGAMIA